MYVDLCIWLTPFCNPSVNFADSLDLSVYNAEEDQGGDLISEELEIRTSAKANKDEGRFTHKTYAQFN